MQNISEPKHLGNISQCYDETFNSYYQHDRHLGAGGQGEVSLAQIRATGKMIVIKRLKLLPNADLRTISEINLLDRVQKLGPHENILAYLQIWNTPAPAGECPNCRIIMPYLTGGDLKTLRKSFEKMNVKVPEAFIWHAFKSMTAGFGHLHENGISHRDVKPENIMLDPVPFGDPALFPTLKIIDFGIAIERTDDHETWDGTPKWQPPEVPIAGAKADVWAIGAVIHFLATGLGTKTERPNSIPDNEVNEYYRRAPPSIHRLVEDADFDLGTLSLDDARKRSSEIPLPRRGYSALLEYYMSRALDLNAATRITIPRLSVSLNDDADRQITLYKAWFKHCKAEGSQRPMLTFAMAEPYPSWTPNST